MLPGKYSLATPTPYIQWQRCPWAQYLPFEQSMPNVLLPRTFAQCLRAPYILCIAPKQKTQHGLPSNVQRKARNPTSTLLNAVQGLACRALFSSAQTLLRPSMGAGVLTNRGHMTPIKGTRTVLVYNNPKCGYKGSGQTLETLNPKSQTVEH